MKKKIPAVIVAKHRAKPNAFSRLQKKKKIRFSLDFSPLKGCFWSNVVIIICCLVVSALVKDVDS